MQNDLHPAKHYNQSQDDEINLRELAWVLWQGKKIIILTTTLFAVLAVTWSIMVPNQYQATVVVTPAKSQSSIGNVASQFGGLASLAGISLSGDEGSEAREAMEIMQSWGFIEEFIENNQLDIQLIAANGWDSDDNRLTYDNSIYDLESNKWVGRPDKGKKPGPTSWALYQAFLSHLVVSSNLGTGMVTVSIEYYSPTHAKEWLDLYIVSINEFMRARTLAQVNSNVAYLEAEIDTTSLARMKIVLYQVLEEQIKTKMLAKASPEYAFVTVSKAMIPEQKSKPKRAIMCVLATILGAVLGLLSVLVLYYCRTDTSPRDLHQK